MLKALMIITMVSGTEYTAKLPSMDQCLKEVTPVESQADVKSASCIPRTEKEDKVPLELFSQFFDMFLMLDEQQKWDNYCGNYYPPKP
jgi:hypothetical protein